MFSSFKKARAYYHADETASQCVVVIPSVGRSLDEKAIVEKTSQTSTAMTVFKIIFATVTPSPGLLMDICEPPLKARIPKKKVCAPSDKSLIELHFN